MWVSNSPITSFFKSLPTVDLILGDKFYSKARNNLTSVTASFVNGDHILYVKTGFDTIPDNVQTGEFKCRIWYPARQQVCDRCQKSHLTSNTDLCDTYCEDLPEIKMFAKCTFSNFANCKMKMDGLLFPTSEHAYQWHACMEHLNTELADKVINDKSPCDSKQITAQFKCDVSICDWGHIHYEVMKRVLIAKADSSKEFRKEINRSGNPLLVESLRNYI